MCIGWWRAPKMTLPVWSNSSPRSKKTWRNAKWAYILPAHSIEETYMLRYSLKYTQLLFVFYNGPQIGNIFCQSLQIKYSVLSYSYSILRRMPTPAICRLPLHSTQDSRTSSVFPKQREVRCGLHTTPYWRKRARGVFPRNLWKSHQSHQRKGHPSWLLQSLILRKKRTLLRTVWTDTDQSPPSVRMTVHYSGGHNMQAHTAGCPALPKKYLTTPATSVPCERLFSLAGHIVQKKRVSLSSRHVNQLVQNYWNNPYSLRLFCIVWLLH